MDFFTEVEVLEAGAIIPSRELQKRLLKVIVSPTYRKLHNPEYSVIANPFTLDYQNCTEHTLDVIVAAIYQTDDLRFIKANEKAYFSAATGERQPDKTGARLPVHGGRQNIRSPAGQTRNGHLRNHRPIPYQVRRGLRGLDHPAGQMTDGEGVVVIDNGKQGY